MKRKKTKNGLTNALARYLRCVYLLSVRRKTVRIKDIAKRIGVTNSATTQAIAELAELGYISHERYGFVELTPKGQKTGRELVRTSKTLIDFFVKKLGLSEEIAEEEVCKMLNYMKKQTIEKFAKFVKGAK